MPGDILAPTAAGRSHLRPARQSRARGPRKDAKRAQFLSPSSGWTHTAHKASCCPPVPVLLLLSAQSPTTTRATRSSSGPRAATATAPAGALPFTNGGTHRAQRRTRPRFAAMHGATCQHWDCVDAGANIFLASIDQLVADASCQRVTGLPAGTGSFP